MTAIQNSTMHFSDVYDVNDSKLSIVDLAKHGRFRVGNYWYSITLKEDYKKGVEVYTAEINGRKKINVVQLFSQFYSKHIGKTPKKSSKLIAAARAKQLSGMLSDKNRREIEKNRLMFVKKRLNNSEFHRLRGECQVPLMFDRYYEDEELNAAIRHRIPDYQSAYEKYRQDWE